MANKISKNLVQSLRFPAQMVVLIWLVHLFQVLTTISLGSWGVYPREIFGLRGILVSPLIHADWGHLISNTPPFFVLTFMLMFFYRRVAMRSFLMIYLLSGLLVWSFGRDVFHIGASGVIYGLVAFVFWTGIFRRNLKSIALALIVVFYYGSMFMGILPGQEGISWESHLFGALVGIFTSFWYKEAIEKDEKKPVYSWEKEPEPEEEFFLNRDAFEKTKQEREAEKNRPDPFSGWRSDGTW